jgi:hypothetical protein
LLTDWSQQARYRGEQTPDIINAHRVDLFALGTSRPRDACRVPALDVGGNADVDVIVRMGERFGNHLLQ